MRKRNIHVTKAELVTYDDRNSFLWCALFFTKPKISINVEIKYDTVWILKVSYSE